jgi:hypothetical protein
MERQSLEARIEHGTAQLAALIQYWLSHGLSQDKLAALVKWAYGQAVGMEGGTISRIRNGNQARGAGIKHLDAFAETNKAIWTWQTKGARQAIKEFGPHSVHGVDEALIEGTIWLPKPNDETAPLDLGDLANLLMGRLDLPYVGGRLSPGQATRASERLTQLLDDLASDQGWGPREAATRFCAAYPPTDRARQHRLKLLLLGEQFSHRELELEMAALAEMIRSIRGAETFTPADLQRELLSDRQLRS